MADNTDSSRVIVAQRISEIPEHVWPICKKGFRIASNLDATKLDKYVSETLETLTSRGLKETPDQMAGAGLSDDDARALILVISMSFAALIDTEASLQDFLDLSSKNLFDNDGEAGAKIIASNVIGHRPELQKSTFDTALAASILPSLEHFDLEVDMRMRFKNGSLDRSAPTVVVHISTDCDGEDLWFQLNKHEVEPLIQKLKKAVEDIELAEKLIRKAKGSDE